MSNELLNRIRKKRLLISNDKEKEETSKTTPEKQNEKKKDEDWLTKKALEEIERSANFHKVKRETFGSSSEPKTKTNKKFLATTLSHALSHNEREKQKRSNNSSSKLKELDRYHKLRNSSKKFGERKHEFRKPEKKKDSDDDR